jgi:hypothetical protein
MAVSEPKPGILREPHFQIQIGDTSRRSETLVTHGLQQFTLQFNRTAVKDRIDPWLAERIAREWGLEAPGKKNRFA